MVKICQNSQVESNLERSEIMDNQIWGCSAFFSKVKVRRSLRSYADMRRGGSKARLGTPSV